LNENVNTRGVVQRDLGELSVGLELEFLGANNFNSGNNVIENNANLGAVHDADVGAFSFDVNDSLFTVGNSDGLLEGSDFDDNRRVLTVCVETNSPLLVVQFGDRVSFDLFLFF